MAKSGSMNMYMGYLAKKLWALSQETLLKATISLFICCYEATKPHQHCFNDISGAIAAPESHKDLQEEPLKAVLISKSA